MEDGNGGKLYPEGEFIEEEWYESSADIGARDFPWIYSIGSFLVIFGVAVLILQLAGETTVWAQIVSAVVFILLALWVYTHEFYYTMAYLRGDDVGAPSIVHMMDLVCAVILVSAGISYTIYVFDNDQYFHVPDGPPYRKFVHFWASSALIHASIGFGVSVPIGVIADVWAIVVPLNIIWLLTFILSNAGTVRLQMQYRLQTHKNYEVNASLSGQQSIGVGETRGGVKPADRRKGKQRGRANMENGEKSVHHQQRTRPKQYPMRLVQMEGGKWVNERNGAPSLFRKKDKKNK